MKSACLLLSFIVFFCGQSLIQKTMEVKRGLLPEPESVTVLPSQLIQIASLEYKSLVADVFFLKALNRFGKTLERGDSNIIGKNVKDWEWHVMLEEIELSVSLDPLFLDPYYFSNAIITHHRPLIPKVSLLLEEGAKKRDWDWELPFYAGFNYFFYLGQPSKASVLLMDAAQRPTNKSSLLVTLASRLAYQGKKTENAILFLRQMLVSASDPAVKKTYETRLKSLEGIYIIEQAIDLYKKKYQLSPTSINQLVTGNNLITLPTDPYGGDYYIDKDGSVKTTSELRPMN